MEYYSCNVQYTGVKPASLICYVLGTLLWKRALYRVRELYDILVLPEVVVTGICMENKLHLHAYVIKLYEDIGTHDGRLPDGLNKAISTQD